MDDIIKKLKDMRYLKWTQSRKSSGTAGSFLKSYDDSGKIKKYYKLSDYDPIKGIVGHECINEIVVQRLLRLLSIDHLEYTLIHALITIDGKEYETFLCESEDFKKRDEQKISLEDFYLMEREEENPYEFCRRMGWEKYICEMLLIDYLVLNRDRHGANIEVLRNIKEKTRRLAPLFDHGLSLVCRCQKKEELEDFDIMADRKVQSFIGTNSALTNIKMIPREYLRSLPKINETDFDGLFEGLDGVMEKEYITKIRAMIWERWCSLDHI